MYSVVSNAAWLGTLWPAMRLKEIAMKVVKAEYAGACYGVQRALDLAYDAAQSDGSVCTLGPLIHNPQVVNELQQEGVSSVESVEDITEGTVILRSHGVVPTVIDKAKEQGLKVVDATCPHVARAHKAAAQLAREGCFVIVVGEEGHPEVEGICAHAQLAGAEVVALVDPDQIPFERFSPGMKVGVVIQTTQSRATFDAVLSRLEEHQLDISVKDTICTATRQRQDAAAALASDVDAFVIIGGRNSSNTTRLYEICRSLCPKSYHIESADELDFSWFDGCDRVGVTAGASTPEDQIQCVIERLEQHAF